LFLLLLSLAGPSPARAVVKVAEAEGWFGVPCLVPEFTTCRRERKRKEGRREKRGEEELPAGWV
jgi:hypothetical protein